MENFETSSRKNQKAKVLQRFCLLIDAYPVLEENDHGRAANRRVLSCEVKTTTAPIDSERRNAVASMIADIQEIPRGGDIAVTGIIRSRPFLAYQPWRTRPIDGEDGDRIVKPVRGVDESAVRRNDNF